ncbi:MAG: CDP-alcohol phosphatidyltransferase family protein [Myxococcota bacterium]|nr:CDP-alcohol phosphatidyltransferase family protein [Myxococcota bacterium]
MKKSKYVYQSAQDSILRPHFQRWVWNPLLRYIPASISPNALTGISTLCCFLSFLLAAVANTHPAAMVAASVLVFGYLSLDNMDGAYARATGQSSRLGEFLDHWLDTLNNGFVVLGACLAVGLTPLFTLLVLAAGTLAFFAVQLELQKTGVFRMGRVADIEGNTAVSGLYLAVALMGPGFFDQTPLANGPSLALLLGAGVMGQALWTSFTALKRIESGRLDCLPLLLCLGVLITWATLVEPSPQAGVGIPLLCAGFFTNPVFTSRPILARLRDFSTVGIDRAVVAGTLACAALALVYPALEVPLAWAIAALLAGTTLRYARITTQALRDEPPVADVSPGSD